MEKRLCPQCAAEMSPDVAQGLCPKCLLDAGLESQANPDACSQAVSSDPASAATAAPVESGAGSFATPDLESIAGLFPQLEILELLGRGGMGVVYKARQRQLNRLVAVKILPPRVANDPAFAERFMREAQALARLNHPNIVQVYDFGETAEFFYFVMEYVDGVNLRALMRDGRLKPEEALRIVPLVCEALQFAHDDGIVHRDIKPENILVDKKGRVKIADFGLAKLVGGVSEDLSLTGTGQLMGTLGYMAPEQLQHSNAVDHRADIYSLGVVFYEMLTRQLPIGRFEAPSKKVQVDVRLDEVVLRALENEPDRRYQNASDVKTDLETVTGGGSLKAGSLRPQTDVNSHSSRTSEGKATARAGYSASVRLLGIIALMFFFIFLCIFLAMTGMAVLAYFSASAPDPMPMQTPKAHAVSLSPKSELRSWVMGPAGPQINTVRFSLQPSQVEPVNQALQEIYREYLTLEKQNMQQSTNEQGHVITVIPPLTTEVAALEDRLWSRLDAILDRDQQNIFRLNLELYERRQTPGSLVSDLVRPGLLGWEKKGVRIEIWREGAWFRWTVSNGELQDSSRAPELPADYRRFWNEQPVK